MFSMYVLVCACVCVCVCVYVCVCAILVMAVDWSFVYFFPCEIAPFALD